MKDNLVSLFTVDLNYESLKTFLGTLTDTINEQAITIKAL